MEGELVLEVVALVEVTEVEVQVVEDEGPGTTTAMKSELSVYL